MRKMIKFASVLALSLIIGMGSAALACDKCKGNGKDKKHDMPKVAVQSYAHPTLFSDNEFGYIKPADSQYVVGAKILKNKNRLGVKNKENVYVNRFSQDLLSMMAEKQFGADKGYFDPKKPILRSELAFALAQCLDVKTEPKGKKYPDVTSNYWAASSIAKAYDANLMIGYPDGSFKPEQAITKAEVFAVIAQMINVKIDNSAVATYKNKRIQYIPGWATAAAKEVSASNLLVKLPDQTKVIESEYLSKEQVAYLIGELKKDFGYYDHLIGKGGTAKDYTPGSIAIKLTDRLSARHSNINEKFYAKTTKAVTVNGVNFSEGSTVVGKVIEVQRPGLKNPGFIKVKFCEIKNGDIVEKFPKNISEAQADQIKNPNVIARILGMPFTGSARVVGVVGRTVGTGVDVVGNSTEKFGDELGGFFVETLSLQPKAGFRSLGNAVITPFVGIYDMMKLIASGTFGILYEITDEIKYVILPSASNDSSLNPGEELTVIF